MSTNKYTDPSSKSRSRADEIRDRATQSQQPEPPKTACEGRLSATDSANAAAGDAAKLLLQRQADQLGEVIARVKTGGKAAGERAAIQFLEAAGSSAFEGFAETLVKASRAVESGRLGDSQVIDVALPEHTFGSRNSVAALLLGE